MLVLSLLATLSTIVLWLIGYHAENQGDIRPTALKRSG
ncbi:hypothetical protein Y071_22630 [Salmonella enterica subsp. enterica serovar Infantis str. CVM N20078]|nr:hypothetical protein AC97_3333 [Escherichia coli 2-177-06_S4_C2]OLW57779.1 hypothetical protein Y071_22630 [Salmonella enterica subsp. enterica serovar Infantis str. CVM N20078]